MVRAVGAAGSMLGTRALFRNDDLLRRAGLDPAKPVETWADLLATVRAVSVTHRGPTLGYRITEGETSLCYLPDHEPALGADLEHDEPEIQVLA